MQNSKKKKRVGIITFHFVNNFGGALQAYALRKTIDERCDADAEIIDYRIWFIRLTDRIRLLPITTNLKEIISGFKTMGQRINRRTKFGVFTRHNSKITRKYSNHWQLNNNPPCDEKFVCGSDQIWNPILTFGVSPSYYLQFEKNPENKIAYAPSFGTNEIKKRHKKTITNNLNNIKYLSVREQSGKELIKDLTGKDVPRLIDPTFLLDKEEWSSIGMNPLNSKEPYILLYIMQRDMAVYEYARRIKEEKGIKLIEISRYGYNPGFVDETLVSVGPDEFLGLFRDAAYVCTNSYHGLAYSIIFEKDFCIIPCKRFTARINNMVDLLQIKNVAENDDIHALFAKYDKDYVREVIKQEKEKSITFLRTSLGIE